MVNGSTCLLVQLLACTNVEPLTKIWCTRKNHIPGMQINHISKIWFPNKPNKRNLPQSPIQWKIKSHYFWIREGESWSETLWGKRRCFIPLVCLWEAEKELFSFSTPSKINRISGISHHISGIFYCKKAHSVPFRPKINHRAGKTLYQRTI